MLLLEIKINLTVPETKRAEMSFAFIRPWGKSSIFFAINFLSLISRELGIGLIELLEHYFIVFVYRSNIVPVCSIVSKMENSVRPEETCEIWHTCPELPLHLEMKKNHEKQTWRLCQSSRCWNGICMGGWNKLVWKVWNDQGFVKWVPGGGGGGFWKFPPRLEMLITRGLSSRIKSKNWGKGEKNWGARGTMSRGKRLAAASMLSFPGLSSVFTRFIPSIWLYEYHCWKKSLLGRESLKLNGLMCSILVHTKRFRWWTLGLYLCTRIFWWAYFRGSLFSEGSVIGKNFAFLKKDICICDLGGLFLGGLIYLFI